MLIYVLFFSFPVLDVQAFERLLGPCMDIMKRNIDEYEEQLVSVFGSKAAISDLRWTLFCPTHFPFSRVCSQCLKQQDFKSSGPLNFLFAVQWLLFCCLWKTVILSCFPLIHLGCFPWKDTMELFLFDWSIRDVGNERHWVAAIGLEWRLEQMCAEEWRKKTWTIWWILTECLLSSIVFVFLCLILSSGELFKAWNPLYVCNWNNTLYSLNVKKKKKSFRKWACVWAWKKEQQIVYDFS